ncbi:Lactoylglutathione lyase [Operophtera brumata]|uniref:Lactoylglutathione lyase n=1 Tax=Operophtera brumata TaxID=104452 RepID=A0A0L7KY24_OPEBR|nr:Lactoylglutathione lyase [Operophtera brumata]
MFKLLLLSVVTAAAARDDFGATFIMRVFDDCQKTDGIFLCLKKKGILFFDRAARMESIPLIDGVEVIRTSDEEIHPISENEIEATLPRNLADKDGALTDMLWDRVAAFANSRTIQFSLPKITGRELNQGVEEGRNICMFLKKTFKET